MDSNITVPIFVVRSLSAREFSFYAAWALAMPPTVKRTEIQPQAPANDFSDMQKVLRYFNSAKFLNRPYASVKGDIQFFGFRTLRLIADNQPYTEEYIQGRVNIFYDHQTQQVKKITLEGLDPAARILEINVGSGTNSTISKAELDALKTMSLQQAQAWLSAPGRGVTFSYAIGPKNNFGAQTYITNDRRLLNFNIEGNIVSHASLSRPYPKLSGELGKLEGQDFVSSVYALRNKYVPLNASLAPPQAAYFAARVDGKSVTLGVYPQPDGKIGLVTTQENQWATIASLN